MSEFKIVEPKDFAVPNRTVYRVFIHCSASDHEWLKGVGMVEEIDRWHKANGWAGVGYHYLIDKEGTLVTGRDLERTPAAQLGPQKNGNTNTIAIMAHGNWRFTPISLDTLVNLCKAIDAAYYLNNKTVTFHGHCEIDPKPCPVFDYKRLLGLSDLGNLFASTDVLSSEDVSKAVWK